MSSLCQGPNVDNHVVGWQIAAIGKVEVVIDDGVLMMLGAIGVKVEIFFVEGGLIGGGGDCV